VIVAVYSFFSMKARQEALAHARLVLAQIQPGMTMEQVEKLIQRRPDYEGRYREPEDRIDCSWYIENYSLDVIYNRGVVVEKDFSELYSWTLIGFVKKLIYGTEF